MDVISYGVASKAARGEKETREDVLAIGVEGQHPHVKARIDSIETAIQGIVEQADKLIVNDAINIMKAHAKLNSIAKTMKYKMQNMIFDDLLDLSGIDTANSTGYMHSPTLGYIRNGVVETTIETADATPEKAVLTIEEEGPGGVEFHNSEAITITGQTAATVKTVEFWMEWNGIEGSMPISFSGYDLYFALGGFGFNSANGSVFGVASAPLANKLVHVMAVFSNTTSTVELYIDGVKQTLTNRGTQAFGNVTAGTTMYISGWPTNDSYRFGGLIRDVRVWNRKLNVSEINKSITGNEPDLIGWYPLSGDTKDYSSYKKDGVPTHTLTYIDGGDGNVDAEISRDGGVNWEPITKDSLFYFDQKISPMDKKLKLRFTNNNFSIIHNYALTWA